MALDKKTFRTRTITALVFVAAMLLGLFTIWWAFLILFLIIMVGCLMEYTRLIKKINPAKFIAYLPLAIFYIVMPVLMILDLGIKVNVFTAGPKNFEVIYSPLIPCAIIFSIWINDTMAYIVGSLIGKTPFSKISPKKTWEGTGGGAILCILVIGILGSVIPAAREIPLKHWLVIAAICAVFGTLGDLLESKLKRMANVKDSGSFMPGHGGFLDRFDSLLVAVPVVWVYVQLFM